MERRSIFSLLDCFGQRLLPSDLCPCARPPSTPTLDRIVTRYLREQHAQCNNPESIGFPFSLLNTERHVCQSQKHEKVFQLVWKIARSFNESLIRIPLSFKYGLVIPSVKILKVESF